MKLAVMTRSTTLFGLICRSFEADDAVCHRFADDVALTRAIYRDEYSAILIDAETGMNPLRPVLARRACYADRRAPLIVVGTGHDHADIEDLFDAGADDVVLSPVESRELVLRVHLALRRFQPSHDTTAADRLDCGPYRLDRRNCAVHVEGRPARLTSREFAIAWLLFSRPGDYVSRRQIAGAVWSSSEDIVGRTLEQHIYKLRKKLELSGRHGVHLRTLYAHGYRIELDSTPRVMAAPRVASDGLSDAARNAVTAFCALDTAARTEAALACRDLGTSAARVDPPPRADVHSADSAIARNAPPWRDSAEDASTLSDNHNPGTSCAPWTLSACAARPRNGR